MCGILGWAGTDRPGFDQRRFDVALDLLSHRGPDDRGIWTDHGVTLGHRRLSIIDLTQAGHQPMSSADGQLVVTYNGEIYNYLELGAQLIREGRAVKGGSDTGVLLEALAAWGLAALERLNGMWAFGVWRRDARQLVLCRDRFGVKPLYYLHGREGLAFASEPKALLELFPAHRRVDADSLLDFLANNQLYGRGRSFYDRINVLPPAHFAVYDAASGTLQVKRYWDYPETEQAEMSAGRASSEFAELFEDAVRLRLRSDVGVGITLSGGLDSTAILAAASTASAAPKCFTSVYESGRYDELSWAKKAADAVGADLVPVAAKESDWLSVLGDVTWHLDGPGYSPAVYPLWCLMKQARASDIPVLLEGQGADEALAGYPQYSVLEFLDFVRGHSPETRTLPGCIQRVRAITGTFTPVWAALWLGREMSPRLHHWHRKRTGFQSLLRPGIAVADAPRSRRDTHDSVRARLLDDHARDILPGLLHYGDAVSMAHSIEARHPFMDYRLVEWLFRLPTTWKISDGETKWVLRDYLRRHGQAPIGNRRDKRGYPTPVADWMSSGQGAEAERRLLDAESPLREWCEPSRIKRLVELQRRGVTGSAHHLYKLLSTQVWLDRCIARRAAA